LPNYFYHTQTMFIEHEVVRKTISGFEVLYHQHIEPDMVQVEKTNPEFEGDFTLVVFPLLRFSKKPPQATGEELGEYLLANINAIESFTVVKGFLNLVVRNKYWTDFFYENILDEDFGIQKIRDKIPYVVEYSSPNTNKPLHLGHIRNNLLGYSISEILKANGKNVIKINLINDRGIHICKSMLAWMKWGNAETPESTGMKGDHLIGKYYVLFDQKHKEEITRMVHLGYSEEDAFNEAPLMKEAQELLIKWEDAVKEVLSIWYMMNNWAYTGFDQTYERLGVDFDKIDYESKMYLLGKELVIEGLEKGIFYKKQNGSVWVDLTNEGLDEKLLLRGDGTSVYITQDIGTAQKRFDEYAPEKLLYVVGNEQIYHFDVLKKVLKKLGRKWAGIIYHLSYGMVELPQGRMKSREGTVVDADDLMDEMYETAKRTTEALGKSEVFTNEERIELYNTIGLGALKYFILKVDPKKNMLFNPEESIDFNGNTGPFILYTYARIQSIFRKAEETPDDFVRRLKKNDIDILQAEKELIKLLYQYPIVIKNAGDALNPAVIANYCYELAKRYNHYYQDTPILKRVDSETSAFRVVLSWFVGKVIRHSCSLLGLQVTDRM
jgi:arginyl-tRNA synthetase